MDNHRLSATREKYLLPNHWLRDPLSRYGLPYFGYMQIVVDSVPDGGRIFDAGCGDGRIAAEMIAAGCRVTGIDILSESVHYARTLVPEGQFFQGDLRTDFASKQGLTPESFDAAVMVEVYEHLPPDDCAVVLANVRALMRNRARLILSVPTHRLPASKLHYRHFSRVEIEAELNEAGFVIDRVIYQHRLDSLSNLLLGDTVERILDNRWIQPVVLKRLRRIWYRRAGNIVGSEERAGRLIVLAERIPLAEAT